MHCSNMYKHAIYMDITAMVFLLSYQNVSRLFKGLGFFLISPAFVLWSTAGVQHIDRSRGSRKEF